MKLRPYQDSAIESVLDAWAIEPRVCLAMPTGTGKTVVAAGLCLRAKAEGLRGAFVTDRLTLLPQTRRTFDACGLRIATIQGSNTSSDTEIAAADVLLCSAQTLDSRRLTAESLGLQFAVVDECHIEREVVVRWLASGLCMVGLTATPLARWMPDAWRVLLSPVTTRDAINERWLLEPLFRAEIPDPDEDAAEFVGPPTGVGGDWSDDQAEQIMTPYLSRIVDAWERVCDLPKNDGGFGASCGGEAPATIVQAATVDHAEKLAAAFQARGCGSWAAISYLMSQAECDILIDQFRAGILQGLVSVAKLAVGFDAPEAACFVSARPTRRLLVWIQWLGRVMRPGSDRAVVIDCAGNAHRFAGRLHRFWSNGAVWPLPEPREANAPPPTGEGQFEGAPCEDHPEVVQVPGAQVCCVCYAPLKEVEKPTEARSWKDGVTAGELGQSVLILARERLQRVEPDRAAKWARVQVKTLTGQWPRRDWPPQLEPLDPFTVDRPHPVVAKLVRANTRAWIAWTEEDAETRPPVAPAETISLVRAQA